MGNIISDKQNLENKSFLDGLLAPENQDSSKIQSDSKTHQDKSLKISSIQVMQNLFSFETSLNFYIPSTDSGNISTGASKRPFFHIAFKQNA